MVARALFGPAVYAKVAPVEREFPEGTNVIQGPFYSNRQIRRDHGERGHGFGYGRMDIRTRRAA